MLFQKIFFTSQFTNAVISCIMSLKKMFLVEILVNEFRNIWSEGDFFEEKTLFHLGFFTNKTNETIFLENLNIQIKSSSFLGSQEYLCSHFNLLRFLYHPFPRPLQSTNIPSIKTLRTWVYHFKYLKYLMSQGKGKLNMSTSIMIIGFLGFFSHGFSHVGTWFAYNLQFKKNFIWGLSSEWNNNIFKAILGLHENMETFILILLLKNNCVWTTFKYVQPQSFF